ncbi:phosphatases II, partial [Rozella allomycis CSF55]
ARDLKLLEKNKVTHILNVAHLNQDGLVNGVETINYNIQDIPEFNFLALFDEITEKMHSVLANTKNRLVVHCSAGISRSATIVIAYLMRYKTMKFDEAFEVLKRTHVVAHPNRGFTLQLKIYESLSCSFNVSDDKCKGIQSVLDTKNLPLITSFLTERIENTSKENSRFSYLRCGKCRSMVVESNHVIDHSVKNECRIYFTEPLTFMIETELQQPSGKIYCKKCKNKLGSFSWSGTTCSCGEWIVPSFAISKDKVDPQYEKKIQFDFL